MTRPTDSNADEWHLFLSEYLDNRATHPEGLPYVAVQIAEAIDDARAPNAALLVAAKKVMSRMPAPRGARRPEFDELEDAIAEAEKSAP
jgi:hypothetical protein